MPRGLSLCGSLVTIEHPCQEACPFVALLFWRRFCARQDVTHSLQVPAPPRGLSFCHHGPWSPHENPTGRMSAATHRWTDLFEPHAKRSVPLSPMTHCSRPTLRDLAFSGPRQAVCLFAPLPRGLSRCRRSPWSPHGNPIDQPHIHRWTDLFEPAKRSVLLWTVGSEHPCQEVWPLVALVALLFWRRFCARQDVTHSLRIPDSATRSVLLWTVGSEPHA